MDRLPEPTGDLRTDALAQLRWAMAFEGLTADKLSVMPAVLKLPVVHDATVDVPQAGRLVSAYRTVVEAARELGDSLHARILRTALAIDCDSDARNLTARRREFDFVGDLRTIRGIETRMLEALVTALGAPPTTTAVCGDTELAGEHSIEQLAARPLAWNLPVLRDPHFVGRSDVLEQIRLALLGETTTSVAATAMLALSGPAGIGKTAIAVEYAYSHASEYAAVWWLRAEEPSVLAADFAALATALGLVEPTVSQAEAVTACKTWLMHHDRWLLVFDNTPALPDITDYIPGVQGHVLITTRNPYWSARGHVLEVKRLDAQTAGELVCRRACVDDPDAAAVLATKLDGIPKLIEVAAQMFLHGSAASLGSFAAGLGDGVAATEGVWDAAFDMVANTPGVSEVLASCSALNPDDIPIELLIDATDLSAEVVEAAVGSLRRQQILGRGHDGLRMHRLVQAAARQRLTVEQRRAAATRLARLLLSKSVVPGPAELPFVRRLQGHAPYLVVALGDLDLAGDLLSWHATCLRRDGAPDEARRSAERAVAHAERTHGQWDVVLGNRLHVLAQCLRDTGDLVAARSVAEQSVAVTEASAPDSDALVQELCTLSTILFNLGEFRAARDAAQHGLSKSEQIHGRNHLRTTRLLNVLASVLRELGEFQLAKDTAERAIAATEASLGPDHLDLAWQLNSLAITLRWLGELPAAEHSAERALRIAEGALGPKGVTIDSHLGTLARIQRSLGNLEAARETAEHAVTLSSETKGPNHPDEAVQLGHLALILADLGESSQAELVIRRALTISETVLGPEHMDVGWQLGVLARVLADLDDLAAGREVAERALKIGEATLGPDSLGLLTRLATLGRILGELGDLAPAKATAERALQMAYAVLGEHHADTARQQANLALILHKLGDFAAARDLAERAVATCDATLGAHHPETVRLRDVLARITYDEPAGERELYGAVDATGVSLDRDQVRGEGADAFTRTIGRLLGLQDQATSELGAGSLVAPLTPNMDAG